MTMQWNIDDIEYKRSFSPKNLFPYRYTVRNSRERERELEREEKAVESLCININIRV
jgi:hypothetical protein